MEYIEKPHKYLPVVLLIPKNEYPAFIPKNEYRADLPKPSRPPKKDDKEYAFYLRRCHMLLEGIELKFLCALCTRQKQYKVLNACSLKHYDWYKELLDKKSTPEDVAQRLVRGV